MAELLIDHQSDIRFTLTESKDPGSPGKIFIKGQFARSDCPTDNKRLYREHLWRREFGRLSEALKRRRVYGELDHPCLTSDDFRVLAVDGWKPFRDIKPGDRVWSRVDGKAVVSTVDEIVDEPYSGEAIRFKGRGIDATFTPAHRFLTVVRPGETGRGEEKYLTAAELLNGMGKYAHSAIPKTAEWFSENVETFVVPGVKAALSHRHKNDVTKDLHIDAKVFAAFMGIYLAEGNCSSDSTDTNAVFVHQTDGWSKDYIYNEVLSKFPPEIQWTYDGSKSFYTADARLRSYLKPLGNVYEKYIPREVKGLGPDCLRELVFWFGIGDGRMVTSEGKAKHSLAEEGKTFKEVVAERLRHEMLPLTRYDVFTVSERLIRDLHECVVRFGEGGVVSVIDQVGDREIEGRVIKEENRSPLFQLHVSTSKNIWLDPRFLTTETVQHDGNIYCLKTSHGNFYMERGGHSFWTGNSDGRTKLQRVSHILTKLDIRGGEVYGEAEVIDTPNGRILKAIAEASGEVGTSSRGFGSVKSIADGVQEVQEDFRLDTFDFVADPATKSAYPTVFREERAKIQEDEMELTVEALKRDYPGLVEELSKELIPSLMEGAEKGDVAKAIIEAEERTRERLTEKFSGELRRSLEIIREEVESKVRSDFMSDPDVASAKRIVEHIASLVMPFGMDAQAKENLEVKDKEIENLRTELADRELEIQKVRREASEAAKMAKEAAYTLHLERKLGDDPSKDAILALVGKVEEYDSREELDSKVDKVREELDRRGGNPQVRSEWEDRFRDMEARLQESEEAIRVAHDQAAKYERQAKQAVRIAEREKVTRIIAEETEGMDEETVEKIRSLAEEVTDEDDVKAIIADERRESLVEVGEPQRRLDEDEADRIRARVGRGKQRDLQEDTHGGPADAPRSNGSGNGPLSEFGMGMGDYNRLSGTGKPS